MKKIPLSKLDIELMDEILKHTDEFEEMKGVIDSMTQAEVKSMLNWLKETPNATRHQIVMKHYQLMKARETR